MYGDTELIRRRVSQLREQGVDIRSLADHLVAQTEGLTWRGRAADAMRERVRDRAGHLRSAASRHETAAETLEKHAHEVDRLKDAIAAAQRRATDQAHDGITPADLSSPPEGHHDWLGQDPEDR